MTWRRNYRWSTTCFLFAKVLDMVISNNYSSILFLLFFSIYSFIFLFLLLFTLHRYSEYTYFKINLLHLLISFIFPTIFFYKFCQSFLNFIKGCDLVDWLIDHVEGIKDRKSARIYASKLLSEGYIRHVVNKLTFTEKCYYIFDGKLKV